MQPSLSPFGATRLAQPTRPASLHHGFSRVRRAAAACLLLAGIISCSTRDANAARRQVRPDAATAAAAVDGAARSSALGGATDGGSSIPKAIANNGRDVAGAAAHTIAATSPDTLLASADVYAGWRSFNINCQSCHGLNAVARDVAPDLRSSVGKGGTLTHAQFRAVVRTGRMARGMPAWDALLDARQIDQIYAYLLARSSGALGAGQPTVGGE